jgi:hypothetical protein
MSHITIECPDCKIEHVFVWRSGSVIQGQFACGCGTLIRFGVTLPARGKVRDPNREENEAASG